MKINKIIKMSTTWCGPCRAFATTFHKVANDEKYNNIEFKEIDIENDEDGELLTEKYNVRSVPTTVILNENDELIYKLSGNISETEFRKIIDETLENNG